MCCVQLEESSALSDPLLNLLQALLVMERSGIEANEIDDVIERAYDRMPPSTQLARLHQEFCLALKEAREQQRQKGSEVTCQLADSTPAAMH